MCVVALALGSVALGETVFFEKSVNTELTIDLPLLNQWSDCTYTTLQETTRIFLRVPSQFHLAF